MPAEHQTTFEDVADVIRALLRTERTFRAYSSDDPIRERTLAALEPRLGGLLPLDLEVRTDQMIWNGHPLLDEREPSDLPARLHRDGIRRVVLGTELGIEELERFLNVIATRIHPDDPHRDYVSLLWEADLTNVRVISIDPYLDLDVPDIVLDGDGTTAHDAEASQSTARTPLPDVPAEAFAPSDSEREAMDAEIAQFAGTPPWPSFIDSLLENLQVPQRRERAKQLSLLLEETFNRLLVEERFDDAARVLAGVRGSLPAAAVFPVRQALERIAHPDRLVLVVAALERGSCSEDQAEKLFLGFGEWAADAVCALLARSRGEHLRRFYVDILVKIGADALEPVMTHLLHAEPSARRYFARALGRLKDDGSRGALISCLDADDAALRAEAIAGLSVHADDGIRARLWDLALGDGEASVRTPALKSVIEDRAGVDCERIVARLEAADLKALGEEEKDLLFKALGTGGGDRALEYLAASLKGRWMPGRSELEGWRRATMALVSMGSPEAVQVLQTHAQGRGKLATICQDALRRCPMGNR